MIAHVVQIELDATPQNFTPDGTEAPWRWTCSCGAVGNAQHVYRERAVGDFQSHINLWGATS